MIHKMKREMQRKNMEKQTDPLKKLHSTQYSIKIAKKLPAYARFLINSKFEESIETT